MNQRIAELQPGAVPAYLCRCLGRFAEAVRALATQPDAARVSGFETALQELMDDERIAGKYLGYRWQPLRLAPHGVRDALLAARAAVRGVDLRNPMDPNDGDAHERRLKQCAELLSRTEARWCRPPQSSDGWLFPSPDREEPGHVLAFPCAAVGGDAGALLYLRAYPYHNASTWNFRGFGEPTEAYDRLEDLARVAIRLVAGLRPDADPPASEKQLLQKYTYELLFDARVSEGYSHTGAVLVLMVVCCLHARSRSDREAVGHLDYDPSTVISAEIDHAGGVRKVEGLEQKLRFAVRAWGGGLTFVLARANADEARAVLTRMREGGEPNAGSCEIEAVGTAEELVNTVLGPLKEAREEWIRRVPDADYLHVWQPLLTVAGRADWDQARGGRRTVPGVGKIGSHVFVSFTRGGDAPRGELRLAFRPDPIANHRPGSRRTVVIACAADDERLWPNAPDLSPVAQFAYLVAESLWQTEELGKTASLFVYLLSEGRCALEISQGLTGGEIDARLRDFRAKEHRSRRGQYARPVLDDCRQSLRNYTQAELYVLAPREPLDLADEHIEGRVADFASAHLVELLPATGLPAVARCLTRLPLGAGGQIDEARVRLHFGQQSYRFAQVEIDFGTACPVCWDGGATNWRLYQTGDRFSLRARPAEAECVSVRFECLGNFAAVGLALEYRVGAQDERLSVAQLAPVSGRVARVPPLCSGVLPPHEWNASTPDVDLVRDDRIVFSSVQLTRENAGDVPARRPAFLAVELKTGRWWATVSGCRTNGTRTGLVFCENENGPGIFLITATGRPIEARPLRENVYEIRSADAHYRVARFRT